MSRIAKALTVGVLAFGPLQPVQAFLPPEPEDGADEQTQERDDALPSLDELLGLDTNESEASAAKQAQRESSEELQRRLSEEDLLDIFSQALEKMALSAHLLERLGSLLIKAGEQLRSSVPHKTLGRSDGLRNRLSS